MPSSDIGMAKSTFIVLESDPRNTQQTSAVSRTASPSSMAISLTESEMKVVVSKMTSSFIPGGRVLCKLSIAAFTALATPTALEPGCLRMPIACTGAPLLRA